MTGGGWGARYAPASGRVPVAVLAAFALAGCSTANTKPGVTKAQFLARADALCQAEIDRLRGVAAFERVPLASLADDPRLIRHAVAIHEATDAKLEALPEPPGEAAGIAKVLTARTIATTVETDTAQALAKHLPAAQSVQQERMRRSAIAKSLAAGYGLSVCGPIE